MTYYGNKPFWRELAAFLATNAVAPPFMNGANVGLMVNVPILQPSLLLADLTLPTYTGYADQAVTAYGDPYNAGTTVIIVPAVDVLTFTVTADSTPEFITGYWLQKTGETALFLALFDNPVLVANTDDALVLVPNMALQVASVAI